MDALYFPSVELPDEPSLTRVLLYWDRVGTIMPAQLNRPLSRQLRELIDYELVRPVDPEPFGEAIDAFADGFITWVSSLDQEALHEQTTFSVHRNKASTRLWEAMHRQGLVGSVYRDWIDLPRTIAFEYMGYLAVLLARMQHVPTEALTDIPRYWNCLTSRAATQGDRDAIRAVVLHDLLPTPTVPLPASEIARFKERYWELLHSFRRAIEEQVNECAALDGPDVRAFAVRQVNRSLRDQLVELQARMGESRWPTTAGTVAAAIVATPLAAEAMVRSDPFAAAGAAVVPLAEVVRHVMRERGGTWDPHRPLAYAALAAEAFGPAQASPRAKGRIRDS